MVDIHTLSLDPFKGLNAEVTAKIAELIEGLQEQAKQIADQAHALEFKDEALKLKDAKLEKVLFELGRLKAWKFGAKTEAMSAQQRQLFEESLAEDQADLELQLEALNKAASKADADEVVPHGEGKRRPRREMLPEHLRRVEHHHEPQDTNCPTPDCGQVMVRMGEDVSERLDIVPAEFFVHRHIRGKWVCKCCQILVQESAHPQVIDKGMPTAGLIAHTLVSRFADHIPYYRQESINARSGVHTPRSTLAAWSGAGGAALHPLYEALREFVLSSAVVQADETPVNMLDPGAGKTKRAYMWGYARGVFEDAPAVVYDFCVGRGAQYPMEFLGKWSGTLVRDEYKAYEKVLEVHGRKAAGCLAHARRKFDELIKNNASPVGAQAIRRIAEIYRIERELKVLSPEDRLAQRQARAGPLWAELEDWMKLERQRVPEGGATAKALSYSLNHWDALVANLRNGHVPLDNNHLENLMRPWAMGRKAWLFCGSELAGQRAAVVMSLVVSARLNGHDPWAYLKDVLTRLPTHPNRHIADLLPHCWQSNQ